MNIIINWLKEQRINLFISLIGFLISPFFLKSIWNNIVILQYFSIVGVIAIISVIILGYEKHKLNKILKTYTNPALAEKVRLKIKLLEYIDNNQGKLLKSEDIKHIIDNVQFQKEILDDLKTEKMITYTYLVQMTGSETIEGRDLSVTFDGKAYLEKNRGCK